MDARTPLQAFVRLSSWRWLQLASAASFLLGLLVYLVLAGRAPGAALLLVTLGTALAVFGAVLSILPVERKITVNRQAEVVFYRVLVASAVWFLVGYLVLWGLNSLSPQAARVPIAWDAPFTQPWANSFFRRVTFWPFYALVLVGCQGVLPTPPGAC